MIVLWVLYCVQLFSEVNIFRFSFLLSFSFVFAFFLFNRLRRVPPATMEKGYPANQQPLHWPSKNMAFVKTLVLAFNTLFVSKVFLWKRGS